MKQMMIKVPRHNSLVDKICFDTWMQTGSYKRAYYKLKEDGIKNSWDRPFSLPGVRFAAQRFMLDNYEYTKNALMDSYNKNGYIVEEKYVEQYMIAKAVTVLHSPERVKFWLVRNNLLEKHKKFIDGLITLE